MAASGLAVVLLLAAACTTSTLRRKEAPTREPVRHGSRGPVHHAGTENAPEITKSVGAEGGAVVLWPRIVPKTDDPETKEIATLAQARLGLLARELGVEVDRRPEPERVCPRGEGCRAVSVGAVVSRKDKGCAIVATISRPGATPAEIVPWVGQVQLRQTSVPFRDPPESAITVQEFASCDKVRESLSTNAAPADEAKLVAALKQALGR